MTAKTVTTRTLPARGAAQPHRHGAGRHPRCVFLSDVRPTARAATEENTMRARILTAALVTLSLIPLGCTAGFRAGGERAGVGAGASVGPPPVVAPDHRRDPLLTDPVADTAAYPPPVPRR
jgi:hypothetical protein